MLDRELQRRILEALAEVYPDTMNVAALKLGEKRQVTANLHYLHEYRLVGASTFQPVSGSLNVYAAKITAEGLDFLAGDGGLGAILGVVTVRLSEDTIRAILIERVEAAEGDPTVKARLLDTIKALPAEGLKQGTLSLLGAALAQVPNAIQLLQKALLPG